jgi:hypothetical protein
VQIAVVSITSPHTELKLVYTIKTYLFDKIPKTRYTLRRVWYFVPCGCSVVYVPVSRTAQHKASIQVEMLLLEHEIVLEDEIAK